MTRDASKLRNLVLKVEGYDTYGDNNKGRILGCGDIGDYASIIIHNVLYVEGLKYNLLSIIQMCDKGHKATFETKICLICESKIDEVFMVGKRVNNVYMLDIELLA